MKKSKFIIFTVIMICIMSMVSNVMAMMPGDPFNELGQGETTKNVPWSYASSWAEEELNKAKDNNLVPIIFNGADLTADITRLEFAHVAVVLYEKITGAPAKIDGEVVNPFTDTADGVVVVAYNLGITNGTSDTTFTPDALITREQMATMMTRALNKAGIDTGVDLEKTTKFADDADMHSWSRESIYYMSNIEIIKGIGNNKFGVSGNATREQALLISVRSLNKYKKSDENVNNTSIEEINSSTEIINSQSNSLPEEQIVFEGTGDKIIQNVNIPAGVWYSEYYHNGSRNFSTKLYYGQKSTDYRSVGHGVGKTSGQTMIYYKTFPITDGIIEVKGDGDWAIKFTRVSGSTTTNISGQGDTVTGVFTATTTRAIAKFSYTGKSNYRFDLYEYVNSTSCDNRILEHGIDSNTGEAIVNMKVGSKYFFEINCDDDGEWSFDLGLGDSLTKYGKVSIPTSKTTNSSNSKASTSSSSTTSRSTSSSNNKTSNSSGKDSNPITSSDFSKISKYCGYALNSLESTLSDINRIDSSDDIHIKQVFADGAKVKEEFVRTYLNDIKKLIDDKDDVKLKNGKYLSKAVNALYDMAKEFQDLKTSASYLEDSISTMKRLYQELNNGITDLKEQVEKM